MRLKLLLLILWTFSCYGIILSQNLFNPAFQNIIPASPEASSITKFGYYPVSLATGIPQISIPLFNYNTASTGLSLSLSFDYFGGGIKVDEEPSIIGIGWALNAGSVISRNLRGVPDELPGIDFMNEPSLNIGSIALIIERIKYYILILSI